jgi:hypothetical protein
MTADAASAARRDLELLRGWLSNAPLPEPLVALGTVSS